MTRQIMRWKMEEMREREHILSVDHLCEMVMTYAMFYRQDPEADSITGPRGQGLVPVCRLALIALCACTVVIELLALFRIL